jgi:PPOX class probable FMN-dependent enzyme
VTGVPASEATMASDAHTIETIEHLRELSGDAHQMMFDKAVDVIDDHIRDFLALTSFITIASADVEGRMDVSPRGDPPGFVTVLDDTTIAIPERPGNRRADTFTNVLQNPSVALLCFVPGMDETMRINGSARLTTDPDLLASMEVEGHVPKVALVVHVEEAFIHCGKALVRGRVWDPDARIDRSTYPSVAEVMFDHGRLEQLGYTREDLIECAAEDYATNVYPSDDD